MALEYGYVVGQFVEVVGDRGPTQDADRNPDEIGSAGTVTFKPTPASITDTVSGRVKFITPRSVILTLDSGGRIVDANLLEGVWLVAGIEYTVTTSFLSNAWKIYPTAENDLEHPLDAVAQMPIPTSPSIKFVVNEQVYTDTLAAAAQAVAAAVRAEDAAAGAENGEVVDSTARTRANEAYTLADGKYTEPAGGIPATDLTDAVRALLTAAGSAVQPAALGGYVPTSRSVTAGSGLTGGGTLSADRSLALSAPTLSSLSKADTAVQPAGLTKAAVGLGNVSNLAPADLPLSTAATTALAAKADLVGGVIPSSQIPAIALSVPTPVASRAAMLALTASQVQIGDVAVDYSTSATRGSYMLAAADPSVFENWAYLTTPLDAVTSVNGQTGPVTLGKADIGLGNVSNLAPADLPISTAAQSALDAKVATSAFGNTTLLSKNSSGVVSGLTYGTTAVASTVPLRNSTGDLTVPATPTATTDAASKSYVDGRAGDMAPATAISPGATSTALTATASRTLRISLTANATFTIASGAAGTSYSQTLILVQDTTGSRTVTWPTGVKWSGGVPTLSTAASAIDIVTLFWTGTEWLGFLGGKAFA